MLKIKVFFSLLFLIIIAGYSNYASKHIRLLILSGRNNHDWHAATPALEKIFTAGKTFKPEITLRPDTLKEIDFRRFDVVLNNWNSWPENDLRWPVATEKALISFIRNGGGFVTFHSSTSVFYSWPEFEKFTTAAWIMDSTWHGKPQNITISFTKPKHQAVKGIREFVIFDELWMNASGNRDFEILGYATQSDINGLENKKQPAVMVLNYGKGRVFHTILGHDTIAIQNPGFRELLIRGTKWASGWKAK